ncbi:MAG TPA: M56 family metallopeptidase [Thermoanaerobaculia bacterium]|jgi:bla regulator protein BlaR1
MTAALASALFAAAWKGTLLVAFALVVHRVARNRIPPRWLCALLLVALVRLLVPVAPAASFSVFNLVPSDAPSPPPVILVDDEALLPAPGHAEAFRAVAMPSTPRWVQLLLGVWAIGVLFVVMRVAVRTRAFHRLLRDQRPVDLGPLLDQCRDALRLRRGVRVAVTNAVATPSLHGFLRPTLLLPHGFLETFTREQLRYVVLHELAHLRRADVLVSWVVTAASALHWFNPLVRLAVARLSEERELACDALALAALRAEERPAYGGTVLELVERGGPMVPALVGMTATPQQLKRRIVMIASFRRQSRNSILFAAAIAVIALATLTDARAGEVRQFVHHIGPGEALSPAAHEQIMKLEQNVSLTLHSASLQDVLTTISAATGVNAVVAAGVLEGDPRLNITAENVPAHVVLMETLLTLKLAAKFTDAGVEVVQQPEPRIRMAGVPGEERQFFIRKADDATHPAQVTGDVVKKIHVSAEREGNEAGKVRVTINTGDDKPAGKLEIDLIK